MSQPLLCHLANLAWLVVVLIGLPSATSRSIGSIQLSTDLTQQLISIALVTGAVMNVFFSVLLQPKRPTRKILLGWAVLFLALALAQWLAVQGTIHFEWLKRFLIWLRETF